MIGVKQLIETELSFELQEFGPVTIKNGYISGKMPAGGKAGDKLLRSLSSSYSFPSAVIISFAVTTTTTSSPLNKLLRSLWGRMSWRLVGSLVVCALRDLFYLTQNRGVWLHWVIWGKDDTSPPSMCCCGSSHLLGYECSKVIVILLLSDSLVLIYKSFFCRFWFFPALAWVS